jgi:chemotaxis-related protein WspB
MLFLHFRIGDDGFALAAESIIEIVPLMQLKKVRQAPDAVAGSFEYRGRYVPVVDLCALDMRRPARKRLSTRIIVVRHPHDEAGLIGLIAENATEMLRLDPSQFAPVAQGLHGLVQRMEENDLLPASLLALVEKR